MKYGGQEVGRARGKFYLTRPSKDGESVKIFTIHIQALEPGWAERAFRLLPEPTPPIVGERKVKQDDGTVVIEPVPDEKDAKYLKLLAHHQRMISAWRIREGTIESDDTVRFEVPFGEVSGDPTEQLEPVLAELVENTGEGELIRWARAILTIGHVGGADIAEAEADMFLEWARTGKVQGIETDKTIGILTALSGNDALQGDGVGAGDVGEEGQD